MDQPSVLQRLASALIGYLLLLFSSCNAAAPAAAPSPKVLVTFKVPGSYLDSAQWSPDGKRIASVVHTSSLQCRKGAAPNYERNLAFIAHFVCLFRAKSYVKPDHFN